MRLRERHLTSEEMDRMLANPAARAESVHLQQCARCFEEIGSLETMFGALRTESAGMAERERARAVLPQGTSRTAGGWLLSATAAALMAVVVGVPLAYEVHVHLAGTKAAAMAQSVSAQKAKQTRAEAMSDEALLNSIQDDLSASEPSALSPLTVQTGSGQSNTTSRKN